MSGILSPSARAHLGNNKVVPISSLSSLRLNGTSISNSNSNPSNSSSSNADNIVNSSQYQDLLKQFNKLKADSADLLSHLPPPLGNDSETKTEVNQPGILTGLKDSIGRDKSKSAELKSSSSGAPSTVKSRLQFGPNVEEFDNDEEKAYGNINNDSDKDGYLTSIAQFQMISYQFNGRWMNWNRMNKWRDGKARREVNTICMAIDSMLDEGLVPGDSMAIEILACRLAALITINDKQVKNAYEVANQLEFQPKHSMVPYSSLTQAMKMAKLYERIGGAPKEFTSGSSSGSLKPKHSYPNHKPKKASFKKSGKAGDAGDKLKKEKSPVITGN